MAADVINLRLVRKAQARKASDKQAAENRVKFGRTKDEKRRTAGNAGIEESRLDGHRLGVADSDKPDDTGAS